ncbi:MAG: diguanylate cyclase [Evtepia sp.]
MKYRNIAVKIGSTLVLIVMVVIIIFDFSRQIQRALTAETYRTLSEVSKTYNKVFNDRISATITTMNMLACHLAEVHISSQKETMDILQGAVNEGGFTKMAACDLNGISLSNEGFMTDISHRDYFKKACNGEAYVSQPLTTPSSDEESIIIAVPMRDHGVVTGVLLGGYPLTVAGDHLLDTSYYSQGYGYIVAAEGTIILSSDHSDKMVDGENLLTFFQKTTLVDCSMAEIIAAIAKGESGSFAYIYQGERRFVSFTPTNINDWYTFSLSSDAPMLKDEKVTNQIVFLLVAKLTVVSALMMAWIILANRRHNQKMMRQEEKLRRSERRFSVAINASSGTLFEVDLKRQLYTHFENSQRIFGINSEQLLADTRGFASLPKEEFVDAVSKYFFHPDDCALTKMEMQKLVQNKTTSYEARLRRYDNSYLWCRVDLSLTFDANGEPSHLVGFMSDIDSVKTQAILSGIQAQKDPMTGLYNKVTMASLSNQSLTESPSGRHALMVFDIDNFKGINDTLGHAFGDLVLIDISTKLKKAFRNNDIIGRMGGDEFAVLMKNVSGTGSVLKKGTELSELFRQTYVGEQKACKISCSIGIVVADGDSFETLYRKADAALYQAKQNGKNRFVLYQKGNADSYPIDSTRTDDDELQNLKKSHSLESYIFDLLYTGKDFESSIHMALAAIGQQYNVSRVSIFEHDNAQCTTQNIYEWCNKGISSKIGSMQKLQLSSNGDSFLDCFDENGLLYCNDVRDLPPYIRRILEEQDVLATLQVTISNDDKTFGFIGFDDCNIRRVWTAEEIAKLSYLSKVLSVFLFKKKTEDTLLENLHTHLGILNILPDYLCVVNPQTHSIEYANNKMLALLPTAQPGAFCFTTLRGGQSAPCETCLIERK